MGVRVKQFDGYELRQLIGRGGMGEVHLAHDTLLDRPVAVKFLLAADSSPESRARFLVEARAVARLQHPNVVSVYRVGEVEGVPYLVSEYVRGTPLDKIKRPVSEKLALQIGQEIARGLAVAHRRGVLHRDIKPSNAMLSDAGAVKLLDFGIAKLLDSPGLTLAPPAPTGHEGPATRDPGPARAADETRDPGPARAADETRDPGPARAADETRDPGPGRAADETRDLGPERADDPPRPPAQPTDTAGAVAEQSLTGPGVALGTPAYMAPEVWRGEPASFRSDIYSLGALLYTLCSARPPHTGPDLEALGERVQHRDARPLAAVAPQISPSLCAIVDRCLRRDPGLRYQSANEVRAALAQLTPEGRVAVIPEGNPYRGLYTFEAEHQGLFFGRDSEIRMILERMGVESFVLVAGDSGVGKSSLCRAGVLPRLDRWFGEDSSWRRVVMIPGRHPIAALAASLAPVLRQNEETVARELVEDPAGIARRLRAPREGSRGVVLFIDQLEELVTLPDQEQAAAMAQVLGWLVEPSENLRLLATARGDFLSRLATLPRIGDAITRALFFLRPLTNERIRDAICGPARAKGVTFDPPELVDELVESTIDAGGGGLPLLQFALSELWEARAADQPHISRDSLTAIGGVSGALTRHADSVLARMSPGERHAARRVLLQLVTVAGTRARKTEAELGIDDPLARTALAALVRGRLVMVTDGPDGARHEIAHEALIHSWATLEDWLSAGAEARRVRERLRLAVAEWDRLGRQREGLWSPRQLREAAALGSSELPHRERAFISASQRYHRRRRLLRAGAAALVPLLVLAVYGGLWLRSRVQLRRRVDALITDASRLEARAGRRDAAVTAARRAALKRFDAGDRERGEDGWRRVSHLEARLDPLYGRATQLLETALMLDPGRSALRARFADLLLKRSLLAERQHRPVQQKELLQRMALYDDGGERRQRWAAPGRVTLDVHPPSASVTLLRFQLDRQGRYRSRRVAQGGGPWPALAPGSYLVELRAAGRARVRYPFVLRRGEKRRLTVNLPARERVPRGFVYIPPGRFLFGSAAPDNLRRDFFHAAPLHPVHTHGYLIGRTEVTFADWIEYLEALPPGRRRAAVPRVERGGFQGALSLERQDGSWRLSFQPTVRRYSAGWGEPVVYPGRQHARAQDWRRLPVVGISVADARDYTAWLDRSGRVPGARLCSELEWERAARGADGREYPHGESLAPADANHDATYGKRPLAMGPDEVGSYPASDSPFGLHDVAGNVWEWTRSVLSDGSYTARGGSWYFGANSSRVTDREITEPTFRDVSVGLRVCADLPPAAHQVRARRFSVPR